MPRPDVTCGLCPAQLVPAHTLPAPTTKGFARGYKKVRGVRRYFKAYLVACFDCCVTLCPQLFQCCQICTWTGASKRWSVCARMGAFVMCLYPRISGACARVSVFSVCACSSILPCTRSPNVEPARFRVRLFFFFFLKVAVDITLSSGKHGLCATACVGMYMHVIIYGLLVSVSTLPAGISDRFL